MNSDHGNFMVAGAGKIGRNALLLLAENRKERKFRVFCGDRHLEAARKAAARVNRLVGDDTFATGFQMVAEGSDEERNAYRDSAVVLDCLPGSQAPRIAEAAVTSGCHYANLTEYVEETKAIVARFSGADTALALQCGLAPGFINVLAHHLMQQAEATGLAPTDVEMRVGALPTHAPAPHFYGITWSSIGVATEYMELSEVIRDGKVTTRPSLAERRLLRIEGETLEEAFTSGGAANLPEHFAGKLRNLDYKTLRYPGHYAWVEGLKEANPDLTIAQLNQILCEQVARVSEDRVLIYAAVEGEREAPRLPGGKARHRLDRFVEVRPGLHLGERMSAIARTTAGALVQVGFDLLDGHYKGIVHQTDLDPATFLGGPIVREIYFGGEP